jgi:membrane protein
VRTHSRSDCSPSLFDLSPRDWKPIFVEALKESFTDNLALVAAGAAFYAFVAIVPLLASAVLIYGIVADPATVARQVNALAAVLPQAATELIGGAMKTAISGSDGKKGLGLVLALAIALFWARNGAAGIITALGIAYEREDKRSILRLTLLALLMTLGAIVGGGLVAGAVFVLAALGSLVPGVDAASVAFYKGITYFVLLLAGAAAAATLYRYAPDGAEPRWQWVTPGSAFCALCWVLLTLGFGFYVERVGGYDATYGSLSAVIVLLTWMWLGTYVLLFGAELNWSARERAIQKA